MEMRQKHRGISQIVGSLFMLAIVVPIGAVVLSQGVNEAAEFNYSVTANSELKVEAVQESIIFEHVRFVPTTDEVIISLRNTGSIDTSINKITIVKMDTQELLLSVDDLAPYLSIKDVGDITLNANLPVADWNAMNATSPDSEYKIAVTTSRGNFFDSVARLFNT